MSPDAVGAVVIGRNEGDRLRRCLESLRAQVATVVYVDSGSTDGSLETARRLDAEVLELDTDRPFTAARARNAGATRLQTMVPDAAFVQFIDGDCTLVDGWIEAALDAMHDDDALAVACGRRRERHPEASVYNRLCDMEWDTPVGEATACGGDALMRLAAFEAVGGFRADVIAGEEPELCVRLREAGWRVRRLDRDMSWHDAAMHRFGQWWRRAVRAGHAYAEGAALHGRSPSRHAVREVRSILVWAAILPVLIATAAWPTGGWSLLGLGLYPVQWIRIRHARRRRGDGARAASQYALFCLLGKFAELQGVATYRLNRLRGRRTSLIEYKRPVTTEARRPSTPGTGENAVT